jgi:hypothetical protein
VASPPPPPVSPPDVLSLLAGRRRILVTGGAVVRRLLRVDLRDAAATADAASMPDVHPEDDQLLVADRAVCAVRPATHHIWCAAATWSAQFRRHPIRWPRNGVEGTPPEPSGPAA